LKYFDFLNQFFKDITDPIVNSSGKIYQYVGDEVVVYWDLKDGKKDNNCVRCFFDIEKTIQKQSAKYQKKFGFVPAFKAGYHLGQVTVGEIGVIKKDIVSSGDVLNTAARIQSLCNQHEAKVLVSKDICELLVLETQYAQELIGEIQLRGKQQKVALYKIEPLLVS
ncbi:MAG: adenylate/guanylate cyclase domain-containing protein, partial [Bacteroidota bacterium]